MTGKAHDMTRALLVAVPIAAIFSWPLLAQTQRSVSFSQVVVGRSSTCAIAADGHAWCWGDNGYGQLGDGTKKDRLVAAPVSGQIAFTQIVLRGREDSRQIGHFACGLAGDGAAHCWGNNDLGQLGDGTTTDRLVPTRVALDAPFADLGAGTATMCGITRDARLYCWGAVGVVALGIRTGTAAVPFMRQPTEIPLPQSRKPVRFIADGSGDPCVIADDGAAYCWTAREGRLVVSAVTPPDQRFKTVTLGGLTRKCGIADGDVLRCWMLESGRLELSLEAMSGRNPPADGSTYRIEDVLPGTQVTQLVRGDGMCALSTGGQAFCARGEELAGSKPLLLQRRADTIALSLLLSPQCGLSTAGEYYCWSGNQPPSRIAPGLTFTQLSSDGNNACGVSSGVIHCWGLNISGQLGDGTRKKREVPAPIKFR